LTYCPVGVLVESGQIVSVSAVNVIVYLLL